MSIKGILRMKGIYDTNYKDYRGYEDHAAL